ncbi:unnamed protein product [Allacma fusca]|uniref:Uncharacterized protein n=1 Tax=Allacma fusca TaxID=39272 RepID=A0A8J2KXM0_9HEXA|nr:unnamed protein product [Allacma fusca]
MLANDTDVDNIKGTKVEAFNIGALYRSQRPKRTGKKGPPLIRFSRKKSLSDLSKLHELHHNDADQFSNVQLSDVSSAEDSSSDGSSEQDILGLSTSLFSQDVTLERSFSELLVLTTYHHMENVLNINGIHLCLCDLKSVTVGLPEEQHQVITYFHPEIEANGECSSKFVSAFIKLSTDDNLTIGISSDAFKSFLNNGYSFGKLNRYGLQYKWGQVTKMLILYKRDDGFWSMFVVKPADHIVLVLNSNGGTTDEKLLSQLLAYCAKLTKTRSTLWSYDVLKHFAENPVSVLDSGVAIMTALPAILNDETVLPTLDYSESRLRVWNFLMAKCFVGNTKSVCTICDSDEYSKQHNSGARLTNQKLICVKCNSCVHVPCIGFNGREARKLSKIFSCQ